MKAMIVSLMVLYKTQNGAGLTVIPYSFFYWKTPCAAVLHGVVNALTFEDETKG